MSNFMSDSDALEVFGAYAEDIKKGKGVIAVRETSPATAAHGVGEYVRYNGTTYKVKSAISIGDSLILNTNIEANGLPDGTTIFTPETVGDPTVAFLDDLGDVDISDPQNGQVPTYNSTTGKFENAAVPTVDISGKADKPSTATEGNFASFDANNNPVDSGHKHSDYLTSHQDVSGKADKPSTATTGNLASFDANKNPIDSGKKASDFAAASHNHSAADINTASTFGAKVSGNTTAMASVGESQLRDIFAGQSDLTPGSSTLPSGYIYVVYE